MIIGLRIDTSQHNLWSIGQNAFQVFTLTRHQSYFQFREFMCKVQLYRFHAAFHINLFSQQEITL